MPERSGVTGGPPALVGRARELALLRQLTAESASGRGRIVFIEGEAGIGKTRLVQEAVGHAEGLGIQTYSSVVDELEQRRPFGAVADCLGIDRSASDEGRAELARLLYGEVAVALAGSVFLADVSAVEFQILDRLLSLVERLCATRPVAIAIENLQWADPATLLFLRRLARHAHQMPLLLLWTSRRLPQSRGLEELVRSLESRGEVVRLTLEPLDPDELTALVRVLAGAVPGPNLVRQARAAGGNPLFVAELLAALAQAGAIRTTGDGTVEIGSVALPSSLTLTILHRLSFLEADTLEVLRVASVFGSHFEVSHLLRVLGRTAVMLMAAMRESLAAGILQQDGPRLVFRHELIRESLYMDLPAGLRGALHLEAARAMAAGGAAPTRFAEHILRGATPGDEQALAWLQRAAHEANPRAPGLAAELLERALHLAGPDHHDRDLLLSELAVSLVWSGRIQAAETICREGLDRVTDPSVEAVFHMALAQSLLSRGQLAEALDVAEAGIGDEMVSAVDRSRFAAWAAICRMTLANLTGAAAAAATAAEAGREADDPLTRCIAISVVAGVRHFEAHFGDGLSLIEDAARLADRSRGRIAHRFPIHFFRTLLLADLDRPEDALAAVDMGRRVAEELGARSTLAAHAWASAIVHFRAGRWDEAIADCDASLELADETGLRQGIHYSHAIRGLIAIHRGEVAAARSAAAAAERELAGNSSMIGLHWTMWARALLLETLGSSGEALGVMSGAWDLCLGAGLVCELPVFGPDLIRLALTAGEDPIARAAVDEVEAVAAANPEVAALRAVALRCRGLVERSQDILVTAVETYRRASRPFELAATCVDAGEALGGTEPKSRLLFEEALEIYERLGAGHDLARSGARMRALGLRRGRRGPRRRPPSGWSSLTESELTVAGLVAQGLSNPEIAERLFLSRLTVRTHVSHALGKLGLGSRVELAAEVVRRGSPPAPGGR